MSSDNQQIFIIRFIISVLILVEAGAYCYNQGVPRTVSGTRRMSTFLPKEVLQSKDVKHPSWFAELQTMPGADLVHVREWAEESWRKEGGFSGFDFIHSSSASVRILDYLMLNLESSSYNLEPSLKLTSAMEGFPILVGSVYFSERAESHKGYCHGGSFTAIADDAIGWMGFCVSGKVKSWSGYTAQINTSLKKPVKVGSMLKVEAWVSRKDGPRKFWISSRLKNAETNDVHYEAEGLFLLSAEES